MIKDIVKIHDKFSVEIKLIYESFSQKRKTKYDVHTYLFIPDGLNINEQTYSKSDFYNDVKVNIRYNTPEYTLFDIVKDENSLIEKLELNIKDVISDNKSKNKKAIFVTQCKLFGSIFSSAVRKTIRDSRKNISKNDIKELEVITDLTHDISKKYRLLLEKYKNRLDTEELKILLFTDEFMSNMVEYNYIILYNYLKRKRNKLDNEIFSTIVMIVEKEQKYRVAQAYRTVPSNLVDNEKLLHTRSQLKKYIDSILFLKKERKKDGAIAEQTLFAIVAGFAMVFSTSVAFYYQQKYGNFTLPFLVALVLSYMLKDRIKSIFGYFFVSKANSVFYDYKLNIYSSKNHKIGVVKEKFGFVINSKLNKKIKLIRLKQKLFEKDFDELGEYIIQYKKRVNIFEKKFKKGLKNENLNSLADITRINFHRMIQQMDNPQKKYYLINNGEIVEKMGDRVYYINIIQEFYTELGVEYNRFRVVLNREGIKRIERINLH